MYTHSPLFVLIFITTSSLCVACDSQSDENIMFVEQNPSGEGVMMNDSSNDSNSSNPNSSNPNSGDPNASDPNTNDPNPSDPNSPAPSPNGMMCHGVLGSDQSCAQDTMSAACDQCQNQAANQCAASSCQEEAEVLAQCATDQGCVVNGQLDEECVIQRCGGEISSLNNYLTCLSMCPHVLSCYIPSECSRCGLEFFEEKVIYYGGCFEDSPSDECIGQLIYLKANGEFLETFQTSSNGEQTLKSHSGYWHTDCQGLYLERCGTNGNNTTYQYLITEDRLLLSDNPNTGYTHYRIWSDGPEGFILDESDLAPQCPR